MSVSVGEVFATLKLRDELSAALTVAGRNLEAFGTKAQAVGARLEAVGGGLALRLTAPIVAASTAALKFSTDFDAAMLKVSTIAAESAESMGKVRKAVLDLAPQVGVGPKALAEGLLVVESTGLKGAIALDVLKRSAQASAIGLGETKDIARAVTAAITAYGATNLSAAEATDTLFAAVKAGGAEADEVAGSLGRVIGIAQQTGVSFQETAAYIATFTRLGIDADEAVTALRGTLSTVLKPTKEASEALKSIGLSIEELRANIKERGLTEALIGLVNAAQGNTDVMAAIVPNVRALAGVLGTAATQADAMREVLDEVRNSAGATDEAFSRTAETGAFKWARFRAELERVVIAFGDKLAPAALAALEALRPILSAATQVADAFASLPQPIQTMILGFGALLAAVGPVLLVFGSLTRAVGDLAVLSGRLATGFGATGVAGALGGVTTALNPATLAMMAFGGAIAYTVTETLRLREEHEKTWARLQELADLKAAATSVGIDTTRIDVSKLDKDTAGRLLAGARSAATAGLNQGWGGVEGVKGPSAHFQTEEEKEAAKKRADAIAKFEHEVRRLTFYTQKLTGAVDLAAYGMGMVPRSLLSNDPTSGRFLWGAGGITPLMKDLSTLPPSLAPRLESMSSFLARFGGAGGALGAPPSRVSAFTGAAAGSFSDLLGPNVIRAITGGGSVSGAVVASAGTSIGRGLSEALSGPLKQSLGKTIGGAIASVLPGVGALLGPAISGLGKLFGMGTGGRDAVREFEQQFGGGDALRAKLDSYGLSHLSDVLYRQVGRGDRAGAEAAIKDVTDALQQSEDALKRYGLALDDLQDPAGKADRALRQVVDDIDRFNRMGVENIDGVAKAMAGPLNDALRTVLETGEALPESLLPYVEALARSGRLAEDLQYKLLGLPAPDVAPWEDMQAAAKRYGIDLDALGARFQQSRLTDGAKELASDWELLVGHGADVNAVMEGMTEKAQEVIDAAAKFGLEIPASMRPMLETMTKAGLLTDGAGEKLEDLSGFKFSEDLTHKIDALVLALEGLVDVLGRIPSPEITPVVNAPVYRGAPENPNDPFGGYDPGNPDGFATGTRGMFLDFGAGTNVRLHGKERVVTAAEGAADQAAVDRLAEEVSGMRRDLRTLVPIAIRDALTTARM